MDRQFRVARLASGILFSPPADIDAKPDVWGPKRKRKFQDVGQSLMKSGAESQGDSSSPMMEDIQRSKYAVFPHFSKMAATGSLTKQTSSKNRWRASIVSPPSFQSPVTLCLPILRVSVDVSIDGIIARTKVTQSFYNPSEIDIPEARHTFPLYYGAAVTSFECKVGDSRRLRGVVKPTAQARREFEEFKKKKREAAALLEELTPEIFETSLGNIPANTTVEIELTYVHELKVVTSNEEKSEGLAVIIPASAAPRYAAAVAPTPTPEVQSDRLEINIKVVDNGTINPVCCHVESNHPSTTYHGLQPSSNLLIANIAELHNFNSATSSVQQMEHVWKYSCESQPILKGDFVFVIQMLEQTRLQSHAVITPANDMGHAALMVSLRPNDLFGSAVRPDLFNGEILFVLDRSGSMGWTQEGTNKRKIETMRNAISLALSGLPSTCRFNIISFGSEVRGMWPQSRRANEPENIMYAREYLTTVKADMGGTEVLLALKGAVNNCEPSCPSTQIILITDGEINREPHDSILNHVCETHKKHGDKIRFFTLGIGDSVSHSVMESIAELGGGYCDVVDVVKTTRWEGCLNRMLRSVMEPDVWTCDIDLGPGYKRQSLATAKFGIGDGGDTDSILYAQGPHPTPSLQPFRYKSFFFLLDLRMADLPKTVTIRTTAAAAKKKTYTMEIKPTQSREGTIHPLAVKMILRNLEDEVKRANVGEEQARLNAEYLGTKYTISSNWTSFVAVADERMEHTYMIDTYKSLFREADITESQVLESEESSEDFWHTVPVGKKAKSRGHRSRPLPTHKDARIKECLTWDTAIGKNAPDKLLNKSMEGGNGSEAHESDIANTPHRDNASIPEIIEESSDEFIFESGKQTMPPYRLLTSRSFNSNSVADQNHLNSAIRTLHNLEKASHSQGGDTHSPSPSSRNRRSTYKITQCSKTTTTGLQIQDILDELTTINALPPDTQASDSQDAGLWEIVDTQEQPNVDACADAALKHEDVLFYQPSSDGPIAWQDAAGCEKGGMFVLPVVVRERLRQHFCGTTAEHLQETLRGSSGAEVAKEEEAALIDTLMMVEYFKTHLKAQEDYWSLLMDKAERALLLALGYGEDQDEALEPFYKTLLSSIIHVHFSESLKYASVYQEESRKGSDSFTFETCLVCNALVETDSKKQPIIDKGYTCLADDCYDSKAQRRKTYGNWKMFWDHQVQSGHLLCPEISERNEDANVNAEVNH
ncbi:hypothetical protein ACHAO4_009895 [Trichoderma viride]